MAVPWIAIALACLPPTRAVSLPLVATPTPWRLSFSFGCRSGDFLIASFLAEKSHFLTGFLLMLLKFLIFFRFRRKSWRAQLPERHIGKNYRFVGVTARGK